MSSLPRTQRAPKNSLSSVFETILPETVFALFLNFSQTLDSSVPSFLFSRVSLKVKTEFVKQDLGCRKRGCVKRGCKSLNLRLFAFVCVCPHLRAFACVFGPFERARNLRLSAFARVCLRL